MKTLLSPRELADAIGASESSLKRWTDGGLIVATRTAGGHRRIPLAEAIRFIRETAQPVVRPEILGLGDIEIVPKVASASPPDRTSSLYTAITSGVWCATSLALPFFQTNCSMNCTRCLRMSYAFHTRKGSLVTSPTLRSAGSCFFTSASSSASLPAFGTYVTMFVTGASGFARGVW